MDERYTRLVRRLLLLSFVALLVLDARIASQAQNDQPHFSSLTAAVQVDVVVRDRKGAIVQDLTAADFDIFENGVKQRVLSCEPVGHSNPSTPAGSSASAPVGVSTTAAHAAGVKPDAPTNGQTVVALVFDWLSEQPRRDAWKAARSVLNDMQPGDYVGVFSIDHSLQQLVPFTRNTRALNAGFELALERPRPGSSRTKTALSSALVAQPEASPTAGADNPGSPADGGSISSGGQDAGSGNADAAFAAMLAQIDAADAFIDKQMQADAASDGLRALVRSLAPLAGRKTVILFSEGLQITNSSVVRWRNLQNEANRHNVAFYTFDAMGLRVESQQAAMGRAIRPQFGDGFAVGQYGDTSEARLNQLLNGPTHGLAELANSTGGQYISNTNDLTSAFVRVNEDRRSYYMLSYSSSNPAMDGSYRTISVKVRRPGVSVRARPGYVAVPTVERMETREYETPAVAALDARPSPMAFPFRLQALSTPMPGQPGMVSLVASIDASALTFTVDDATARYSGQVTVLARMKTRSGETLFTRSEHYNLTGETAKLEHTKAGSILFFTAPEVPAGSHTVEWVVRDDEGARASVARSSIDVPGANGTVVGDLILVGRSEAAPKDKAVETNPLAWKGQLLYPRLGQPISRAVEKDLSFALPIVLPRDSAPPAAVVRLVAGGKRLAESPLDLGTPAKDGRLVAVGHLSISPLPPGSYELQVAISPGQTETLRTADFTVTN